MAKLTGKPTGVLLPGEVATLSVRLGVPCSGGLVRWATDTGRLKVVARTPGGVRLIDEADARRWIAKRLARQAMRDTPSALDVPIESAAIAAKAR